MFNMLNLVLFKNWLVTNISFMSIFIERLIDDNDYHTYNLNKIMKSVLLKITCIYKKHSKYKQNKMYVLLYEINVLLRLFKNIKYANNFIN